LGSGNPDQGVPRHQRRKLFFSHIFRTEWANRQDHVAGVGGRVVDGDFGAFFRLEAGDAYYMEPGHTTVFEEDTEVVEFSPKDEYQKTMEVAGRNFEAMQRA